MAPTMPRAFLAKLMAIGVYGGGEAARSDNGTADEEAGWQPVKDKSVRPLLHSPLLSLCPALW